MTFTFSAKEGDRLLVITTANPCYLLDEKIRTGMSRENVLKIAGTLYPGKPETETEGENGNDPAELCSYPGSGVDLWIGNGRLIYFQVSPPLGTDDTRIWPER
ncbi:MAG: hypothetical protein U5N26_00960 [Candidatus Marinimicrobia bacterium]|nr:hypothetical protein [Candidatus Neomarinimicrobiota bacterium]